MTSMKLAWIGYAAIWCWAAIDELRRRWCARRARRALAAAAQIAEWQLATHLEDCRRGIHRWTIDADSSHVLWRYGKRTFDERCVDCGLTVPFGIVTEYTLPHTQKRRSHG